MNTFASTTERGNKGRQWKAFMLQVALQYLPLSSNVISTDLAASTPSYYIKLSFQNLQFRSVRAL
jgi:hypothetical protein